MNTALDLNSSKICWIGISFDNPYFTIDNVTKTCRYIFNTHKHIRILLPDMINEYALRARNPELSDNEIIKSTQVNIKRVRETLESSPYFNQKLRDIKIELMSGVIKKFGLNEHITSCRNLINSNKNLNSYIQSLLEKKATNYLNKKTGNHSLDTRQIESSKRYLLEESLFSFVLSEKTSYAVEVSPYSFIGIVPSIYNDSNLKPLRDLIASTPPNRIFRNIRLL